MKYQMPWAAEQRVEYQMPRDDSTSGCETDSERLIVDRQAGLIFTDLVIRRKEAEASTIHMGRYRHG